jgi:hypothetical protein
VRLVRRAGAGSPQFPDAAPLPLPAAHAGAQAVRLVRAVDLPRAAVAAGPRVPQPHRRHRPASAVRNPLPESRTRSCLRERGPSCALSPRPTRSGTRELVWVHARHRGNMYIPCRTHSTRSRRTPVEELLRTPVVRMIITLSRGLREPYAPRNKPCLSPLRAFKGYDGRFE